MEEQLINVYLNDHVVGFLTLPHTTLCDIMKSNMIVSLNSSHLVTT